MAAIRWTFYFFTIPAKTLSKTMPTLFSLFLLGTLCSIISLQPPKEDILDYWDHQEYWEHSSLPENGEIITIKDYCGFLNTAPEIQTTGYDLSNTGQLFISGKPGSYRYEVVGEIDPEEPVSFLSWKEATAYCHFKNSTASPPFFLLSCCDNALTVDPLLKSNVLLFSLRSTEANAYEMSSPGEAMLTEHLLDEVIEELLFGIVTVEAADRLRRTPNERRTHPSTAPLRTIGGGYLFPNPGGGMYRERRYTEHALERMAPETPEIIELLKTRAFKRAKAEGVEINETLLEKGIHQSPKAQEWWKKYHPQPREITPMEIETEIAFPHSTHLKVITSEDGAVITVMMKKVWNMKKRLKEIQYLAERTAKQFGYYPTLFEGRKNKVKTFSKKIAKSTSAFDGFNTDRYMTESILKESMIEGMERMNMAARRERRNRSPKVVTISLSQGAFSFTKITLSSTTSYEVQAREADRCNPLQYQQKSTIPFGTLFTRWIEPYLKEKLKNAAAYTASLKNSERSYMEEILLNRDKNSGSKKSTLISKKLSLQTENQAQEPSGPLFIQPRPPLFPPSWGKSYLQALCSNLRKRVRRAKPPTIIPIKAPTKALIIPQVPLEAPSIAQKKHTSLREIFQSKSSEKAKKKERAKQKKERKKEAPQQKKPQEKKGRSNP